MIDWSLFPATDLLWEKKGKIWLRVAPYHAKVQVASEGGNSHNYFLTPDEADEMADALKSAAIQGREAQSKSGKCMCHACQAIVKFKTKHNEVK